MFLEGIKPERHSLIKSKTEEAKKFITSEYFTMCMVGVGLGLVAGLEFKSVSIGMLIGCFSGLILVQLVHIGNTLCLIFKMLDLLVSLTINVKRDDSGKDKTNIRHTE